MNSIKSAVVTLFRHTHTYLIRQYKTLSERINNKKKNKKNSRTKQLRKQQITLFIDSDPKTLDHLQNTLSLEKHESAECQFYSDNNSTFLPVDLDNIDPAIQLLRQMRRWRPINSIFLTIDLLQEPEKQIEQTKEILSQLHRKLKLNLPIYLIVADIASIDGCESYFSGFSKEALEEPLGFHFSEEDTQDEKKILDALSKNWDQLIERTSNRLIWTLHHNNKTESCRDAYKFPTQLKQLQMQLTRSVESLFKQQNHFIHLKGIFLCHFRQWQSISNTQSNNNLTTESNNQLIPEQQNALQTQPFSLIKPSTAQSNETYFIDKLFHNIKEFRTKTQGLTHFALRLLSWKKWLIQLSLPCLIALSAMGFYSGYRINNDYRKNSHQMIDRLSLHSISDTGSRRWNAEFNNKNAGINVLLRRLDAIKLELKRYDRYGWMKYFIHSNKKLHTQTIQLYNNLLQHRLMPLTLKQVEDELQRLKDQDSNYLYALFKSYLEYRQSHKPVSLPTSLASIWHRLFRPHPRLIKQLYGYFMEATQFLPIKLPLNQSLIESLRQHLKQTDALQRAYSLLNDKSSASNLHGLNLARRIDPEHQLLNNPKSHASLPALFTGPGYRRIFIPYYKSIAAQVARDNLAIGLKQRTSTENLANRLRHYYLTRYSKVWRTSLAQLHIRHFKSAEDMAQRIKGLLQTESLFSKLKSIILNHATIISAQDIKQRKIVRKYQALDIQQLNALLNKLYDSLQTVSKNPNHGQAAIEWTQSMAATNNKTIVDEIITFSETTPQTIRRLLNELLNEIERTLLQTSANTIDDLWKKHVHAYYRQYIINRFPFNQNSQRKNSSSATQSRFNHLYENTGILTSFINNYLSNYIDTSQHPWLLRPLLNQRLPLPQSSLRALEKIAQWRESLFQEQHDKLAIQFLIQPKQLSTQAASAQLNCENFHLLYQHGPRITQSLNWDSTTRQLTSQPGCSIAITNFKGRQYRISEAGPWAWFRLLRHGRLSFDSKHMRYHWSLHLGPYRFDLLISIPEHPDIIRLLSHPPMLPQTLLGETHGR